MSSQSFSTLKQLEWTCLFCMKCDYVVFEIHLTSYASKNHQSIYSYQLTPTKTNMTIKHPPFEVVENVFPIENWRIFQCHVGFQEEGYCLSKTTKKIPMVNLEFQTPMAKTSTTCQYLTKAVLLASIPSDIYRDQLEVVAKQISGHLNSMIWYSFFESTLMCHLNSRWIKVFCTINGPRPPPVNNHKCLSLFKVPHLFPDHFFSYNSGAQYFRVPTCSSCNPFELFGVLLLCL